MLRAVAALPTTISESNSISGRSNSPRRWSSRPRPRRCCSVISSSPGELEPVFQAMLENAVRICEAKFGTLFRREGRRLPRRCDASACRRHLPSYGDADRQRPGPRTALARVVRDEAAGSHRRCHQTSRLTSRAIPSSSPPSNSAAFANAARRADAQGQRADRRHSPSTARRCGRSPTSRSSWYRTSPPRPSSPSRTRGCSTSCASAPTI